mmetsp:Transcript_31020/g.68029  ORF Transcript_31020/g.68029 Transcript_31020/m.68029 type:complete len:452 (-) Transcript_31020:74-1429(-)
MATQVAVCLALLLGAAAAAPKHHALHRSGLASIPLRLYRGDCSRSGPALLQDPGAGMNVSGLEPFGPVLKDGFFEVACVKDYMFENGDKHGDGKFAYAAGDVSGVSIVHYTDVVPKEDQEKMSPEECFRFCRSVPEMMFFGIAHGRDCYCAPYYKAVAGDSSACDQVCEGSPTQMCGGASKSSLFEMHLCADAASNLASAQAEWQGLSSEVLRLSKEITAVAGNMQESASALQKRLGAAGDPTASDLMQSAKAFAGELEHAAEAGAKLGGESVAAEAADDKAAEASTQKLEALVTKAEAEVDDLSKLKSAAASESGAEGVAAQYYPVMYFVDKAFEKVPSTCGGTSAQKPLMANADGCAEACDALGEGCPGYSYFPSGTSGLCFLFSKLTSVTYYTGCGSADSFLQKTEEDVTGTKCVVKFEDFEGTTLAPDASGKCEKCLKKATKAERCF